MTKLAGHSGKPTWFAVATSLSKYPFVSSQILYNASNAPSNAFGSFEASKFSAINCHNCGADCHPFCRTHIANDVHDRLTILRRVRHAPSQRVSDERLVRFLRKLPSRLQVVLQQKTGGLPNVVPVRPVSFTQNQRQIRVEIRDFEHSCNLWYINCWFAFGWMYSCKSCPTCCTPSCAGCHDDDDDDAIFPFPLILYYFCLLLLLLPSYFHAALYCFAYYSLNYYSLSLLLLLPVSLSLSLFLATPFCRYSSFRVLLLLLLSLLLLSHART